MEKATLSISKTNRGTLIVEAIFSNKKKLTVQNINFKDKASLHGKEVGVERVKGQIVQIVLEGNVIFSKLQSGSTQAQTSTKPASLALNHAENIIDPAHAPYNFVPLNNKVVEAEKLPEFDRYHENKYTGYIGLEIETKTHLFIRGNKESSGFFSFFSPVQKRRIPGSSLRGLTRTMVEIMSFGKFTCFDDKRLYYRKVGDSSSLGIKYRNTMGDSGKNIKAGILKKEGLSYKIYPSKEEGKTQIYRIHYDKTTKIVKGTETLRIPKFDFKEVYFKPVAPAEHTHGSRRLFYAKLDSVAEKKDDKHTHKCFIIASGEFGNRKHMHWVINEPTDTSISVNREVIRNYKDDVTRDEGIDWLKKLERHKNGIPCFYITNKDGEIISFGHTGMFRLAYQNTIGDHIPECLKDGTVTDIAGAIFGNEKTFAGRVFFEDAFLKNSTNDDCEDVKVVTLSGPKPTTFQHYLVQTDENMRAHPQNLANYDTNQSTAIRGHKIYWHKENPDYKTNGFNSKIDTKIEPVKDKTFVGKIRFENLSKVELGALLFALDLPNGCCHKLGMGKPLGLGSVKITPILFLSKRKERYENLFTEWETPVSESSAVDEKIEDFKNIFATYVFEKLGENGTDLWKLDRMGELKRMLDFESKPSGITTVYMELPEFTERKILPKPSDI